ncbi:MAG TPA: hypothetical protein VF795_08285 [Desulfuromonadaceae bacterium]
MKTALILSIFLLAAPAVAKTVIIEYPDHYYVEVTGAPSAETASSTERRPPAPAREPAAASGGGAGVASARPVTSFDNNPTALDPQQRRALMTDAVQRLQQARQDMLQPRDGETTEQAGERERQAAGMLRRINKMSAELLNMP